MEIEYISDMNWRKSILIITATVIFLFALPAQAAVIKKCLIKGNVTKKGKIATKIYHLPGMHFYKITKIVTKEGDKWFCTEKEAKKAGFRKSKL